VRSSKARFNCAWRVNSLRPWPPLSARPSSPAFSNRDDQIETVHRCVHVRSDILDLHSDQTKPNNLGPEPIAMLGRAPIGPTPKLRADLLVRHKHLDWPCAPAERVI
jgi:hypothetical protein